MKKDWIFTLLFSSLFPLFSNAQIITTVVGNGTAGYTGNGGPATSAELNSPADITFDALGNLYIAEFSNHTIRKVNTAGVITTIAGTGTAGYSGDGGPASLAKLNYPQAIVCDDMNNIYISDMGNYRIRKITSSTGVISTIAGIGSGGFSGDGGSAGLAQIFKVRRMRFNKDGLLFFSDSYNNRIRKIDSLGMIFTVVGNGTGANTGDGGPASSAEINLPWGIDFDAAGAIYFTSSDAIRYISNSGVITKFAGSETTYGCSGNGGLATNALMQGIYGITYDKNGNLYLTDTYCNVIRKINQSGIITAAVGNGTNGYGGDNGPPLSAKLNNPAAIAFDSIGNMYIADQANNRIRKVTMPVSIQPFSENIEFSISPNPASNILNIEMQNSSELAKIRVTDVLGKDLRSETLDLRQGKAEIDVSAFQNGVYFLTVKSGTSTSNQKFIVNH